MNAEDNRDIEEIFDVESTPVTGEILPAKIIPPKDFSETVTEKLEQAADEDFEEVRLNLKSIIDTSNTAVQGILNVAKEGEEPRAYEVVSDLIKTSLDANSKLMQLHKSIKDIKKKTGESTKSQNVTNNNVFVGSTAELSKFVKEFTKNLNPEPKREIEKRPPETREDKSNE